MAWVIRSSNHRRAQRSLLQNVQGNSEAHPVSYSLGTKGSFSGYKAPGVVPPILKMSGTILSPLPPLHYAVMACIGKTFYLTCHLQQSFTVDRWVEVYDIYYDIIPLESQWTAGWVTG